MHARQRELLLWLTTKPCWFAPVRAGHAQKANDSAHHSRLHLRRGVVGGVVVEHERRETFGAMWEMRLALLERQRALIAHARGLPHVMLCAAFGVPPGHEKTTRRPPGFARVPP